MKNRVAGVSLIEILIAFAIMGILVALGVPQFTAMIQRSNVKSAVEFYGEGMRYARSMAIQRNVVARFLLDDNNGWTVAWCQPTSNAPCNEAAKWTDDRSRSGNALGDLKITTCPGDVKEIDFSALGWVTAQGVVPMAALRIDSPNIEVRSAQLQINLSGTVSQCDPTITSSADSRYCQTKCS